MPELEFQGLKRLFSEKEMSEKVSAAIKAHHTLMEKNGIGSEYTGFVELPRDYDRDELKRILKASEKIREQSDVLIVIGVGGSYLGARAVIELLTSPLHNRIRQDGPEIYFSGHDLSTDALSDLAEICEKKDFSVNVISKSGTTLEPAIAFRFFRRLLEKKYGKEGAKERIYCTTDRKKGTLKQLANREGWECFTVPDNIGGRFSVLTPVGLLPIAVAGIDVETLLKGAKEGMEDYAVSDFWQNPAIQYAALRNLFYEKGKDIEMLVSYEPAFLQMAEWWKQLFGESEGKNHKGIFPAASIFSTDLHSFGQFIQDGRRSLFETVVCFEETNHRIELDFDEQDSDKLNYLSGRTLSEINEKARMGALLAHTSVGVPNIVIKVKRRDPFEIGKLIYFFEIAVSVSGYLMGVNPFDQPGVEFYKRNMFALLGKPGYEDQRQALEAKID